MSEFDPIQFGKLINAVENFSISVQKLSDRLDKFASRLDGIEQRLYFGKGIILGAVLFIGGLGAGVKSLIDHLTK